MNLNKVIELKGKIESRVTGIYGAVGITRNLPPHTGKLDKIVVLDDVVARGMCQFLYQINTHVVPSGLPGIGLATGDRVEHEGKKYLFGYAGVAAANAFAVYLFRPNERLYLEWQRSARTITASFKVFLEHLKTLDKDLFGIDYLRTFKGFHSVVGWSRFSAPPPTALQALGEVLSVLQKMHKRRLATEAERFIKLLEPFSVFEKAMNDIRERTDSKGYPLPSDEYISFNTPAASGGASWFNTSPTDNILHAVPSKNNLSILFIQVGKTGVAAHFGQGSTPGKFWTILPSLRILKSIQKSVDADAAAVAKWRACQDAASEKGFGEWESACYPHKIAALKQEIPAFIENNVLGLEAEVSREDPLIFVRPIVSKTLLEKSAIPQGIGIEILPLEQFLLDVGDGFARLSE